ncbi:lipoprotein [Piscinibacter sp.]|uniref:LPS translocon maturation chaperone LptM n=1 Tax=Piscinibacter sp. TaxID=1903157 RepID=UPI0034125155
MRSWSIESRHAAVQDQCTDAEAPRRSPRPHGFVVIAACFALAGLSACGQKGPLIAPKPATAASAPASR